MYVITVFELLGMIQTGNMNDIDSIFPSSDCNIDMRNSQTKLEHPQSELQPGLLIIMYFVVCNYINWKQPEILTETLMEGDLYFVRMLCFYNVADIFLGGINLVDQLEAGGKNSYVNQANKRGVVFFG